MPPSGFNQKAINGLLTYVREEYSSIQREYEGIPEQEFLITAATERAKSGTGLDIFIAECFRDLSQEIKDGCDKYDRPVVEGLAIDKELKQIGNYLAEFTL